jgi:small conductance mechanosensitive channel
MQTECEKHPLCIDNRSKDDIKEKAPKVMVKVVNIADSGVLIRAWAWSKDPKSSFLMGCDLLKDIKIKFDLEDIEIPYPHRTIISKKPDIKLKR